MGIDSGRDGREKEHHGWYYRGFTQENGKPTFV